MKMQEESLKTLDLLGIAGQPHALRVSKYGMTFVKVDVPLATVRWFPLKEKTGRGFGYVDYKAATLMYDMGFNEINIKWGSLIKNSPNKNTIKSIVYTIYIANSQSSLQSAMQCEQYVPNDIMVINHVLTKP